MERREWMYELGRHTNEYQQYLTDFMEVAETDRVLKENTRISCPCADCKNCEKYEEARIIYRHLVIKGFMPGYTCWSYHGELLDENDVFEGNINENGANNDDSYDNRDHDDFTEIFNVLANTVNQNVNDDENDDENDNDDAQDNDDADGNDGFQQMFADSKTDLYSGSKYKKLYAVLKLLNLKANHGWSDKSFTNLLKLLHDMLPEDNKLPISLYEARKMLCPMGLEIERIAACPNDCMLFRNQHSDLHECLICGASRYECKKQTKVSDKVKKNPPPAKVLWYFPIIPRLKRLFANPKDAKLLRWHEDERKKDGYIRHVADSPQWRNIDDTYDEFGNEIRNIRFGLSSDGINPFGNMSSRHSTWPVLLCIYNLPPWLCMKRKYIMMSLLIQGPKQPGNDIDVYLSPLIDDLKTLWSPGVQVHDGYLKENFRLRAMIFCTISDFPAYGNLSGYGTKGAKACPLCQDYTCSRRLKYCKKTVYMGHRRSLPPDHPYRNMDNLFDGYSEFGSLPPPLDGETVFSRVENIDNAFGKKRKRGKSVHIWKKKSIFWDLPYWKDLQVRHCIDVMHIEKNVCDSLIGLLLNIPGKTKDGVNARKDMVDMKIRPELAPQENSDGKRTYLPAACYTLSKVEKTSFCKCLNGVKVPSGYSSNVKRLVSMKDNKLLGMKSHDCHVLMTQMIPIAIRGILPEHIRHTITKLCLFFNSIHSKVIDPEVLDSMQQDVIVTLCQLEMYFPPSFFDVMVHLVSHIVYEIKACGPVFLRYMYPFERYMGFLKKYVRNKARPEGSIVEGYAAEEIIEFCTDYLQGSKSIGLSEGRHEGRLAGFGTIGKKEEFPSSDYMHQAHYTVLQHMTCIGTYVHEHKRFLKATNRNKSDKFLAVEHYNTFASWLKDRVSNSEDVDEEVKRLAYGPSDRVTKYQGYDINGYTFYTKQQDAKSTLQNSGVTLIATTTGFSTRSSIAKDSYYGVIEEIVELDYHAFSIPMLKCKWVENRRGVKVNNFGITTVDLSTNGYASEPFILAKLATQVFYIEDPSNSRWHVVLHGKRRILGVENVVDEEEYDQLDELPPFPIDTQSTTGVIDNTIYLRSDHAEGLWIDNSRSN